MKWDLAELNKVNGFSGCYSDTDLPQKETTTLEACIKHWETRAQHITLYQPETQTIILETIRYLQNLRALAEVINEKTN